MRPALPLLLLLLAAPAALAHPGRSCHAVYAAQEDGISLSLGLPRFLCDAWFPGAAAQAGPAPAVLRRLGEACPLVVDGRALAPRLVRLEVAGPNPFDVQEPENRPVHLELRYDCRDPREAVVTWGLFDGLDRIFDTPCLPASFQAGGREEARELTPGSPAHAWRIRAQQDPRRLDALLLAAGAVLAATALAAWLTIRRRGAAV